MPRGFPAHAEGWNEQNQREKGLKFAVKARTRTPCAKWCGRAVKLWRRHHLTYDQTKHVVEDVRRELRPSAPRERRRTVDRLDREETLRLIETAYRRSSSSGLMWGMLFHTGARVSEFMNLRVEDLALDPPQVYIAHAKGGATETCRLCLPSHRNCGPLWRGAARGTCSRATGMIVTPPARSSWSSETWRVGQGWRSG